MLRANGIRQVMARRTFFGIPDQGVKGKAFIEFEQNKISHAGKTAPMWKNIFFFTGVPIILAAGVNAYMIEKAHFEHMEHHPPHFKDLPYLHLRNKPFPWRDGNKSLFYNAWTQPMSAEGNEH